MRKYRIIEESTGVYVQRHRSFLGLKWWSYLTERYGTWEGPPWPIDYKSVEAAKKAIETLIAGPPPPKIILWPTPLPIQETTAANPLNS